MRVAVVGGGIAGLAAAWELSRAAGARAEVTLYEPGQLGGKLRTTPFLGRPVDEGPDALLTRVPEGLALCSELGLDGELEGTKASKAMLFSAGKLRPLPEGLVLGAPARLLPLLRSRILSAGGVGRAALDVALPRSRREPDVSVWNLVASRLGPQVAERLVEPLLGSIHAGSTRQLSAAATAPQLLAAARAHRSLIFGLRRSTGAGRPAPSPASPARPLFVAPRNGMQDLASRLVGRLTAAGTRLVSLEVSGLRREGNSVIVEPDGERYDGVVLAIPAPQAFGLLRAVLGDEPVALAGMDFVSVAVVTLGFDAAVLDGPYGPMSGVLVAPGSGLLMTACSFGSNKWPHWANPGAAVLRVSVGRAGEQSWAALDDDALVARLTGELATVLGQHGGGRDGALTAPLAWRVSRWPGSMPQYTVNHLERVESANAVLARRAPMVSLAGASYSGVGVPACIGSGRRAAGELLRRVEALGSPAW
jgi:protoporphyrinogen/coproporphyrinogen III oxidase